MAQGSGHTDDPRFDWLALERVPRVGPLTIARLMEAFGSPGAAFGRSAEEIRKRTNLGEKISKIISEFQVPEDDILRDLDTLDRLDVRLVTRQDADYPENLSHIYDPPALLFVRGEFLPRDRAAVAVVGTRNPTRYGLEMTEQISRELSRRQITLVSGLARGIDTACHRAALSSQGRTIGVLGCGIDVTYPRENRNLIEDIVASGAVISEFRPGVAPHATNFYRRNRIVSGLSKGVLVVEATTKSGSLITANHAAEQNREVFAVPGNVMNLRSRGPHKLLKQGAGLVESAEDVLSDLFPYQTASPEPEPATLDSEEARLPDLAQRVLNALDPDPISIDFLCESLSIEAGTLSGVLLELELTGAVRQHPGKMFSRVLG